MDDIKKMTLKEIPKELVCVSELQCSEISIPDMRELQQYRQIGTLKECREAREKRSAKKIVIERSNNRPIKPGTFTFYKCPMCGYEISSGFYDPPLNEFLGYHKFCETCGQAIDWSEGGKRWID